MIDTVRTDLIRGIIGEAEFKYLSKNDFNEISIDDKTVLISITDPGNGWLDKGVFERFNDVLSIQFWDFEERIGDYEPISKEQGREVRDFIVKNKKKNFLIHCKYGESRSAAVGLAVSLICEHNFSESSFSIEDNEIMKHGRYTPNIVVYNTIVGGSGNK